MRLIRRTKFDLQLDDLRDIPDPDRGSPGPGAASDIDLSHSYPFITIADSIDGLGYQIERKELTIMGMPAEEKIDSSFHRCVNPSRLVIEEDDGTGRIKPA